MHSGAWQFIEQANVIEHHNDTMIVLEPVLYLILTWVKCVNHPQMCHWVKVGLGK